MLGILGDSDFRLQLASSSRNAIRAQGILMSGQKLTNTLIYTRNSSNDVLI